MAKISVAICCANAEDTLEAACRSVAWADELVIVDSGSQDATPRIAKAHADRYVAEPWRGYTEQKRYSAQLCRNDWVLILDADEECSPELAAEIGALDDSALERRDVFLMRRRNYVMGRRVRSWAPDWQSRLIHRTRCRWAEEALHDARLPSDPSRAGRLRGALEHKRCGRGGFRDYFDGRLEDGRLLMVAEEMRRRGKRCGWADLALRPPMAFAKHYFLKRGFLDGLFGLLIAQKAAAGVRLKYAALWALQNGLAEAKEPVSAQLVEPSPSGSAAEAHAAPTEA